MCPLLLAQFQDISNNPKDSQNAMDRRRDLQSYIKTFNDISLVADNLIKKNDYSPIQFYGIILCYLNFYDNDKFNQIIQKLYAEKCEQLYEILLIYYVHLVYPIKQNLDFFVKFIDYCTSKNAFNIFEKALNYITDIETFIIVVDKAKEKIAHKYAISKDSFRPIRLKANLKLIKKEKNEEIKALIDSIESINNYSKEKKILLVYFTSDFLEKNIELL